MGRICTATALAQPPHQRWLGNGEYDLVGNQQVAVGVSVMLGRKSAFQKKLAMPRKLMIQTTRQP